MKVVAHVSDPHFGSHDPAVAAALLDDLNGRTATTPAVIAVSGDLTQRAREAEFRDARRFLDLLIAPAVVVPGNHDVPLYDLAARFFHPYRRYQEHITADLTPSYVDDELAVVGLNTAHGFTFKNGRVTVEQARAAAGFFAQHDDRFRIVVAHHPFVVPADRPVSERVDGADAATPILLDAGVHVICSGHLHVAYASDTAGFRDQTREIVAVHAGTCISTRRRGEVNGYNRLILDGDTLTIRQRRWDGTRFADGPEKTYRRIDGHWRHAPEAAITAA